jgi:FHS family L-fucose permease-like MFS transporter
MMQVSTSLGSSKEKVAGVPVFPVGQMLPFLLVSLIFFLWGMSNNLTDILVQQFKKSFELSLPEALLVQTAVFLAYGTMAIPAAQLMRRYGYKTGVLTGLILFGGGTFLFWPAAVFGRYTPFLIALFVCGAGQSVLETACNPFMAEFGPAETSERRLNFAQAFNPPGTITGALCGTLFIFSGIEKNAGDVAQMKAAGTYAAYLHSEIMRVVPTYVGMAGILFLLALFIARTKFPKMKSETQTDGKVGIGFSLLGKYPHLRLAVIAQFFYVGAQVATWSTLIPYMKVYTTETEKMCGYFLTGTLVALMLGRFFSTWLMRWVSPKTMLWGYSLINIALCVYAVLRPGMGGAIAIVATSFFMSVMFPTIFALGVKGLGADTKLGGSLIVMAILGGALFPPLMGVVARATGSLALGYLIPAAGYVVVALYGYFDRADAGEAEIDAAPVV